MKLILMFLMTVLLNQMSYATGAKGEDPNRKETALAEAGSTFTSAVASGDQPKICEVCEENKKARLSNSVGVLTTADGGNVVDSSGQPVQTGQ